MWSKSLLFSLMLCLVATQLLAQGNSVKGVVESGEDGSLLAGVNVVVKNTLKGASTDIDGIYFIDDVSSTDILVFMYVGFQNLEVTVGDQEQIDVRLIPEAFSADEIVVVGYGTQLRKNITSSISSLDEYAFTKGANSDPQALLQSRIPGVQVTSSNGDLGGAQLIRIRGGTSVSASNDPLIVIDGVPISNSSPSPSLDPADQWGGGTRDNALSMINPSDIASIDVLKDASSAAIYGARGGNGVILITTKEGQIGGSSLSYETYTSTSSQSKELDFLTASEYKAFANEVGAAVDFGSANTNWQDEIVRAAVSHGHNLSFSSGTKNTSYLVSLNYLDEEGIILESERQRVSARLNIKHKAFDGDMRIALRLNPSYITKHNTPYQQTGGFEGSLFTNVYKMNPTNAVKNADGSYTEYGTSIRNPVQQLKLIQDETETLRLLANADVEYDFMPGLTGKVNVGLDRSSADRSTYHPSNLPQAQTVNGRAALLANTGQNVLFETTMNYNTEIDESQNLQAWVGYSFQEFEDSRGTTINQDFVSNVPGYNDIGSGADKQLPSSFREQNRLISFLGRVNYSLNGKYLLSAAVRREGSSRFGEDNKWGMFPSASVGWILSEEEFMQDMTTLSNLKTRISYGITGNQEIGNYRSMNLLGAREEFNYVIGDQVLTGIAATQNSNPDLKWEETTQTNFGIDFGFMNNKISGSVDIYDKTTTDLLLDFTVPQPAVVETRLDNVGEMSNQGIEIALNTINIADGDWFWRTSLNFATNSNEVIDLGGHKAIFTGRVSGAGLSGIQSQAVMPGHPLGTFLGPKFLGYADDGTEILSTQERSGQNTGGPLGDGRYVIGDANPDFTLGFSSMVTYQNWDMRIFFQAVQGNDILNNTRMEYQRPANVFNGINLIADARDDVKDGMDPNGVTDYSDKFIEDGSFIRLQNLTLGYTFKTEFFRNLRLYFSADNLFVITDYSGYDPEINTFTDDGITALGLDYTNVPKARTFTLGLNVGIK